MWSIKFKIYILYCVENTQNVKFSILATFDCTVQQGHIVEKQISRTFSSCKYETIPMKHFPFPSSLQLLVTFIFLSVSINLTILDVSHKRNYKITQYFSFCDWLISLSTTPSSFIQVVLCVRISLLLKGWIIFHGMYIHFA